MQGAWAGRHCSRQPLLKVLAEERICCPVDLTTVILKDLGGCTRCHRRSHDIPHLLTCHAGRHAKITPMPSNSPSRPRGASEPPIRSSQAPPSIEPFVDRPCPERPGGASATPPRPVRRTAAAVPTPSDSHSTACDPFYDAAYGSKRGSISSSSTLTSSSRSTRQDI